MPSFSRRTCPCWRHFKPNFTSPGKKKNKKKTTRTETKREMIRDGEVLALTPLDNGVNKTQQ